MLKWLTDGEPAELFLSSSPSASTTQHFFQVLSRVAVVFQELLIEESSFPYAIYEMRSSGELLRSLRELAFSSPRIDVFLPAD
jgi:hypothetical protein